MISFERNFRRNLWIFWKVYMSDIQVFKNFVVSFFFILFSKRPDPIKCPVRTNAHPIAFVFKQVLRVLNWSITVLLDMSAFDNIWLDTITFKLRQNGISGNLLNFLANFLSHRKQCVVFNTKHSCWVWSSADLSRKFISLDRFFL